MAVKKTGLGKGLEALFCENQLTKEEEKKLKDGEEIVQSIKVIEIEPNRNQPRRNFPSESIEELAKSIERYGIIQPIIVSKKDDFYEIIAGERRWRAAKKAGLKEMPCIVRENDERKNKEIALIENIQREDLNPIDEASSISNIIKLKGYTQEEFASKFGKSRTYVTNLLGLLKLPDDVKRLVEKKAISMSHARVLSKMDDEEKVNELAKKIVTEDMSVRDLERLSQDVKSDVIVKGTSSSKKGFDHKYRMYENIIMDSLDTKVRVSKKKIEIYFDGVEELEEILSKMNVKVEEE